MHRLVTVGPVLSLTLLALGAASCVRGLPDPSPVPEEGPEMAAMCPVGVTSIATALIGPAGGTLSLNGHRLTFPAGSLRLPTPIVLIEPASQYIAVEARPDGLTFQAGGPTLEISTQRCTEPIAPDLTAQRWENGSWVSLRERTRQVQRGEGAAFEIQLDHLSIYALGTN